MMKRTGFDVSPVCGLEVFLAEELFVPEVLLFPLELLLLEEDELLLPEELLDFEEPEELWLLPDELEEDAVPVVEAEIPESVFPTI